MTPLVDRGYIERLTRQIGGRACRGLVDETVAELRERTARLRASAEAGDRAAMAQVCHDLVAVAGNVGLARLSEVAREANRGALDPDGPPADRLAAAVGDVLDPSLAALDGTLGRIAPR